MDHLISALFKKAIKRSLFSGYLQRAIKRSEFGLELVRKVRPYGREHFFHLLRQLGFAPSHLIDVGAENKRCHEREPQPATVGARGYRRLRNSRKVASLAHRTIDGASLSNNAKV